MAYPQGLDDGVPIGALARRTGTKVQTIRQDDLIKLAADMLPPPEDGKRDTRRQHVTRALGMLAKEKDGPLAIERGLVVLFE